MSILDAMESNDAAKRATASALDPQKFENLGGAMKSFVEAWPMGMSGTDEIRASGAYFLCPREFVLNYWKPKPSKSFDMKSQLMMSTGTHLHWFLQNIVLGPMGINRGTWVGPTGALNNLPKGSKWKIRHNSWGKAEALTVEGYHPDPEQTIDRWAAQKQPLWQYEEYQLRDDLWRISGHTDGIISLDRVNWLHTNFALVKSNPHLAFKELQSIGAGKEGVLEIKTTNSFSFSKLKTANDIPDYYKTQAVIYQKMTGLNQTVFWFIDRDTMNSKVLTYTGEDGWWNQVTSKARIVWESIRDETLPDTFNACKMPSDKRAKGCAYRDTCFMKGFNFKLFVDRCKKDQPDRDWLDLTGKTWPV